MFICRVKPVSTEEEALAFLNDIRRRFSDARHNVYAYALRGNGISRFSDDGEPHGTAGLPTLDVLRKGGIVDAVAVTTRYFGGILLGTGGLVRAYSLAASMAVERAGVCEMAACAFFPLPSAMPITRACRRWPTALRRCGSSGPNSETG